MAVLSFLQRGDDNLLVYWNGAIRKNKSSNFANSKGRPMTSTRAIVSPPPDCTFDADDWQRLAMHWYPIALSDSVRAAPVAAMLLDVPLVVYRVDGKLVVARDVCPHRGVPLSIGKHDGEGVVCRYHGLRFGEGGRCNRIPASPNIPIPAKLHLRTYPARSWCRVGRP
jgi:nitrite reductase/ring-hydroxylating ferredoxin subunit